MHLDELILYGSGNRIRRVPFRPGQLNIITGDSRTGKSSLINIIRFCLGADSPHVPAGPIRESVEWYGLVAHIGPTSFFIGRPAPEGDTTSAAMLLIGAVQAPHRSALQANTTGEAVRDYVGGILGIAENLNVPAAGQTRRALAATIVHALYYCFQGQGEIANPDILFHRQNREWQPQAIRDTLPYFLGATDAEELRLRQDLTEARRDLRRLQQRLASVEALRTFGIGRAAAFLSEAREVGLLVARPDPETLVEARNLLRSLVDATASALAANFGPAPEFQRLQRERFELRQEQREIADQVLGLEDFSFVGDAYGAELNEQRARLSSIGLVPNSADQNAACAMCGQHLGPTSATAHEHVLAALNDTSRRMDLAQRDRPRIERARAALIARRNAIVQQLEQNDLALTALSAVDDLALRSQESLHLTSYVRGRISSFLDEGSPVEDNEVGLVMSQLEAARQRVAVLEDRFDPAEMRSRVTSILASVSRDMTRMASELGLEHAQTGARIDIDRLTVVADTPTGPAYMDRGEIGSGMNWVGYHLSTYLALQRYFITNRRPVPRFIVLDQPSQAFFPRDRETGGDMDELSDTDRESTRQLYSLINDVVDSLDGTLQVIALDHADFGDDWFADSVIHRWRGGTALIPADWLS